MAWRERWLAVILARSLMARPVDGRHEHAGDEARQDIERRSARRLVEVFPGYRCKAWRKRAHRQIGRVEKGQIQSRKARFNCTAALLLRRRLDRSAAES